MNQIIETLRRIRDTHVTMSSDYARAYAREIAECASRGFATNCPDGYSRNIWTLTPKGAAQLTNHIQDQ